jgi:hypothetical protein
VSSQAASRVARDSPPFAPTPALSRTTGRGSQRVSERAAEEDALASPLPAIPNEIGAKLMACRVRRTGSRRQSIAWASRRRA